MPESLFARVSKVCNFIIKEALAQVLFCEFCENSQNTFSYKTPPVAASAALTNLVLKFNSSFLVLFINFVCEIKNTNVLDHLWLTIQKHYEKSSHSELTLQYVSLTFLEIT